MYYVLTGFDTSSTWVEGVFTDPDSAVRELGIIRTDYKDEFGTYPERNGVLFQIHEVKS